MLRSYSPSTSGANTPHDLSRAPSPSNEEHFMLPPPANNLDHHLAIGSKHHMPHHRSNGPYTLPLPYHGNIAGSDKTSGDGLSDLPELVKRLKDTRNGIQSVPNSYPSTPHVFDERGRPVLPPISSITSDPFVEEVSTNEFFRRPSSKSAPTSRRHSPLHSPDLGPVIPEGQDLAAVYPLAIPRASPSSSSSSMKSVLTNRDSHSSSSTSLSKLSNHSSSSVHPRLLKMTPIRKEDSR